MRHSRGTSRRGAGLTVEALMRRKEHRWALSTVRQSLARLQVFEQWVIERGNSGYSGVRSVRAVREDGLQIYRKIVKWARRWLFS